MTREFDFLYGFEEVLGLSWMQRKEILNLDCDGDIRFLISHEPEDFSGTL